MEPKHKNRGFAYTFDIAKCLLSPVFDERKCMLSCTPSCDAYRGRHVDEAKLTDEADMLMNDFYGKHNVKALIHGKHEIKSILKEE